ncbi:protection of telomeres protein 1a-like isoform X9 [Phalaenopsis equestris]|uniref:protection of telomeres protein 1a-like isoform X9 n=1 Tax=Phalaenopsis equestris TaxID=78828 RepID=UPI0009E334A4|nr:protection of telomeres protein 1a-like isoform X9 [Phalaenopsis equestris]
MAASSRRSFYLTIRDIRNSPIGSKVNLIAKAIEIGVPRKSGGSDYFLTLKLVDETEPTPGFSVNIFEDNLEKLPRIKFPGDIISLQCVELNVYGGDFFCTFKRRISSFALFDGKAGGDLTPYQTSLTRRFLASNADEKLVLQLRALSLRHQQEVFKTLLLCNIESDKQLDIVCKVLDVYKTSTNDWIVLVWDGTDSPVLLQNDLDMEAKSPIRPELYDLPREVCGEVWCRVLAKFVSFVLQILMYYTEKEFMKIALHLMSTRLFQAFAIHLLLENFFGGYPAQAGLFSFFLSSSF